MEKSVMELTMELCELLRENYNHNGSLTADYTIQPGNKYLKVVHVSYGNSRSVHGFVDKCTGDLYMAASWRRPAKGVRFNLHRDMGRLRTISKTRDMWTGAYLYRR